jgi:protein O-mannosyl-transferase
MQQDANQNQSLSRRQCLLGLCALFAFTLIAYAPAFRAGFVWDDDAITNNELMRSGRGLVKLWTEPAANPREEHYWPVVYSAFWLQHQLWGPSALGYHAVGVLLHVVNSVLLWQLLRRLKVRGAWFAGAVFALHPVHVESVAWVIELKDVLSAFFYLVAFGAYLRFLDGRCIAVWWLAFVLFVCGLLSKSMVVTLPLAFLVYHWWQGDRIGRRVLLPVLPFFVVATAIICADLWLIAHSENKADLHLSVIEKGLLAARTFCFYAGKILWPANLAVIYPRWEIAPRDPRSYVYLVGAIGLFASLFTLRRRLTRGPFAALAFYVITLAPVLGFMEFAYMMHSFVADRFQYLASAGPIALAASLFSLVARAESRTRRTLASVAGAGILLTLGIMTFHHAELYRNTATLLRSALQKNPDAWVAHRGLAADLVRRGRMNEALAHFQTALDLKPDSAMTHYHMANALLRARKTDDASQHFQAAIRLKPDFAAPHLGYGVVLASSGRMDEAAHEFREALRLDPRSVSARKNLDAVTSGTGTALPNAEKGASSASRQ